ncbi:ATP-dependent translocase ABCB1-like isoform X2 [Babylonia areolata]|uniref:ATP-dependent translocase ABCB1-like isoform X2 n=1 Tax=Babylonia areolata TaxID=304850 RepID=UPI003FD2471E
MSSAKYDLVRLSASEKADDEVGEATITPTVETTTCVEGDQTEGEKTPPVRTASLGELFSFATCLDKILMVMGSVTAMGVGAGSPLMAMVFGNMVNDFINGRNGTHLSFSSPNTTHPQNTSNFDFESTMKENVFYFCYIGVGSFSLCILQMVGWVTASERQVFKIRKAFFKAILRQDMAWFDTNTAGELNTRLSDDLERVRNGIGDKSGMVIQVSARFVTGMVISLYKGWRLTLVMMSVTPVMAVSLGIMVKMTTTYTQREQAAYAKAGAVAEEVFSSIRTVISFGGWRQEIKRYRSMLEESETLGVKKNVVQGVGMGIFMMCVWGVYGLAFWYGSTQVYDFLNSGGHEGMSPGDVLTLLICMISASSALGLLGSNLGSVAEAKGCGGKVFELIKRTPPIDSSDPGGERPGRVEGKVQFKGVTFSYPSREDIKVLKRFDLTIEPGQTVALVGGSGCGKSTIIKLIQRFYDPDTGSVELDGQDISGLNIHWLRRNIGIVSQEPVLFSCSIKDNIRLGNPDVSDEDILQAARNANAHDFISGLPKGYDTLVGERGAQLSGGQKQRVAIARALVRNPRILLLDEATSALDSESERVVQNALDKAREGRTTVVVAHRLSTIQNADVINVLQEGELMERGTHSELMEQGGLYHQLVKLQHIAGKETKDGDTSITAMLDKIILSDTENYKMEAAEGEGDPMVLFQRSRAPNKSDFLIWQTSGQMSRTRTVSTASTQEKVKEKTETEAPEAQPSFCEIMSYNRKEWPFIVIGCLNSMLIGATIPAYAVLFSKIIAVYSEKGDQLLEGAVFWSLMFVVLAVANCITQIMMNYFLGLSGERLTKRLRLMTFENLLRQDVAYFDDPHHATGALTTRLATDASTVKTATGIRIGLALQAVTCMATSIVIGLVYGWKLALVAIATLPLIGVSSAIQMRATMGSHKKDTKHLEVAGKTSSEAIDNISTVQSLTREPHFYDKYCTQLRVPYKKNLRNAQVYALASAFSNSLQYFIYAGCFRFGAYLFAQGEMEAEAVFRVYMAVMQGGALVGRISSTIPDYSKGRLAAAYIFRMMRVVPSIDNFSTTGLRKEVKGHIELQNVEFHYPTRPEIQVLKGISLQVGAGQTAALVGISGCGKSTIMALLQRHYDATGGTLLIDGEDIRALNVGTLRSMLSVVSQEPVLFDCSVRENIVYGLQEDVAMADIIEACKTANIHEFLSSLPQGYDTQVGGKGTQLSGGQKQRVAIARAIVRNPRILLLDEATSALDTESEKVVQQALDNAREGRTCIVVAHRLSTIQNVDVIFVMENGQVLEKGTHQELLALHGAYAGFVSNQKIQ